MLKKTNYIVFKARQKKLKLENLGIKSLLKRSKSYKRQKFKSFKISERFRLKTIIRDKIIPPSILFKVVKLFP